MIDLSELHKEQKVDEVICSHFRSVKVNLQLTSLNKCHHVLFQYSLINKLALNFKLLRVFPTPSSMVVSFKTLWF